MARVKKSLSLLCFLDISLIIVLLIMGFFDYFLLGTIKVGMILFIIFEVIILALIIIQIVIKKSNSIISNIFLILSAIFMVLIISFTFVVYSLNTTSKQYYFKSPKKSNTMIINEDSFFYSSNIKVYEKKYFIFKKLISDDKIWAVDGYKPFKNGKYRINWLNEKRVRIYFYGKSDWNKATIKLD